jgi:hypothetical protein
MNAIVRAMKPALRTVRSERSRYGRRLVPHIRQVISIRLLKVALRSRRPGTPYECSPSVAITPRCRSGRSLSGKAIPVLNLGARAGDCDRRCSRELNAGSRGECDRRQKRAFRAMQVSPGRRNDARGRIKAGLRAVATVIASGPVWLLCAGGGGLRLARQRTDRAAKG